MSYVYCAYLSFSDIVAPVGAAAHHVGEGRFLLVSTSRICAFFATLIAVTVGPAVLWVRGADGWARPRPLLAPRLRPRPRMYLLPWFEVLASCKAWNSARESASATP